MRELELWNPKLGLVEAGGQALLVRHVYDCLAGLPTIRAVIDRPVSSVPEDHFRAADIGSGAGLPGLLLAIELPTVHWDLVERQGRRAGFLLNVKAAVKLANVSVQPDELERLPDHSYNLVTCRAFRPLDAAVVAQFRRILRPGGVIVLYKGRWEKIQAECANCGLAPAKMAVWEGQNPSDTEALVIPLVVPNLDEERHLVILS